MAKASYIPTFPAAVKIALVVVALQVVFKMFPQTRIWEKIGNA